MTKHIRKIDKRLMIFGIVMLVGTAIFWITASLTDWESTKTIIFRWEHWYFMDWFGELHRIQTGIYSGEDIANYPAFCFLIYYVFFSFLSVKEGQIYDDFSVRDTQRTMYPFFLFMLVIIFCLYQVLKLMVKDKNSIIKAGTVILLFLTSPYVFLFERGNLVLIALLGTCIYILLYDSDKLAYRIIAYIGLSVAAAIKIYPAIFGILTVIKKRYKEAVLLLILGSMFFILPFSFFGGLEGCQAFINSIFGSFDTYFEYGFGYDFSIYNLERLILSVVSGYHTKASNVSILIAITILVVTFFVVTETWQKIATLCLVIILIPKFSYYYTLCFLAIPFIHMLNTKAKRIHYVYLVEYLLIFFPWLHFPIDKVNFMCGEEMSHVLGWGHIFIYIGILMLLFTLLIDGVFQRVERKKIQNYIS